VLFVLLAEGHDPVPLDVGIDPTVLLFTAGLSLLTTMLFGLAPALNATRVDVAVDLKENAGTSRGESGTLRLRGGKFLVVAQFAMSLPLVVGAGEGEIVLVVQGSSARLTDTTKDAPVDATIMGIVDYVEKDATIHYLHLISKGIVRCAMNLKHPTVFQDDSGKILNDWLAVRPPWDQDRTRYVSAAFFYDFCTLPELQMTIPQR
jgi:microcompartment protein CcmK/EutM